MSPTLHHRPIRRVAFATIAVLGAAVALWTARAVEGVGHAQTSDGTAATQSKESQMVNVRTVRSDGTLSDTHAVPKMVKTEAEWKAQLTPEQYRITRSAGTERAFCGGLLKNKESGYYLCVCCSLPLFKSDAKFESGTGWPSFYQPVVPENVSTVEDRSFGMVRTEINCARCDGHLGHVFEDGPPPTGLRYCLNSESLRFVADKDLASAADATPTTQAAR